MLSDSDGEFLLNIARKVVENTAKNEKFINCFGRFGLSDCPGLYPEGILSVG